MKEGQMVLNIPKSHAVAILSPFALYSGHHFNYTRELAGRLVAAGTPVQIHITCGADTLRAEVPDARVFSVCPWLRHVHRWLKLDTRRDGLAFKIIQNFETLACALSLWWHRRGVSAVYWQDARHQIMLFFIRMLREQTHVNLVLGPIPFGGLKFMKLRIRNLYKKALSSNRLTFVAETVAIVEQWKKLAGHHVVHIPVALGKPHAYPTSITRKNLGIAKTDFVCLLFGTHRGDKDYLTVVRAAKAARSRPFLLFAGPLISTNDPKSILDDENYTHGLSIIRRMEEEEASAYFALSDCAILPYAKNYEKGSAVLLQACKYNIPVITSRSGHLQRFVEEFQTGMCYEPGDSNDLANRIDAMAAHNHQNPTYWDRNLAEVRRKFSWEVILPKYLKLFKFSNEQLRNTHNFTK